LLVAVTKPQQQQTEQANTRKTASSFLHFLNCANIFCFVGQLKDSREHFSQTLMKTVFIGWYFHDQLEFSQTGNTRLLGTTFKI